mgnify:CR=1 FL=1
MENRVNYPVVNLCGGRGMRLNERTEDVPKPMVEIGGIPILQHIMQIYASAGFKRFILCLGYKGDKIRDYFMHLTEWRGRDFTLKLGHQNDVEYHQNGVEDWTITFTDTGVDAETALRLKRVEKYIDAPRFLMTYGDGVTDLSINTLIASHERHKRYATVTSVRPRTHFGMLKIDSEGTVKAYDEKPVLSTYVNGGFFCLDREVFQYIGKENEAFERGPMQRLIKDEQLATHIHDGFWGCMDTFKDYLTLNDMWARNEAPWRMKT